MMVRVPAPPADAKAFPVSGSKPAPSVPAPVRRAAITLPLSASMITILWLSPAENNRASESALLRGDDSGVGTAAIHDEHALGDGFVGEGVGILAGLDASD